eukprot:2826248-Amphidinium_carterae.2
MDWWQQSCMAVQRHSETDDLRKASCCFEYLTVRQIVNDDILLKAKNRKADAHFDAHTKSMSAVFHMGK